MTSFLDDFDRKTIISIFWMVDMVDGLKKKRSQEGSRSHQSVFSGGHLRSCWTRCVRSDGSRSASTWTRCRPRIEPRITRHASSKRERAVSASPAVMAGGVSRNGVVGLFMSIPHLSLTTHEEAPRRLPTIAGATHGAWPPSRGGGVGPLGAVESEWKP